MINLKEVKFKNYNILTYKGIDIIVSPELIQDINARTHQVSVLEETLNREYNRLLPLMRNKKIDIILNEFN